MSERTRHKMEIVERIEDIPAFTSEDEEHQYWATHSLGDTILDRVSQDADDFLPPPRPRTRPVPIRFSDNVIERAKALAALRHTGYQTLLKEFVIERLYEEEKRSGLR